MANFQDFQLIKTAVERAKQDYGEKYNFSHDSSIAFCWFVLENIFNLQEDEIDEALTDTNYLKRQNRNSADDSGIDAAIIDDNKKEVNLINFKYIEDFEKSKQKHFPSNELNKVLVFLDNLFNKEVSCEINQILKEKCQEIFDIQETNRLHFNIFYISNHFQGLQRNKLEEFKHNLEARKIGKDISVYCLQVDELTEKIINTDSLINAKVKSISGNFFEKSESGNRALIMELYAKDIIRIVSNDEDLRDDIQASLEQIKESEIDERAFNDNVRIYLHQRTNVNKSIKSTAIDEIESSNFFFYNNGITVTCNLIDYQGKRDVIITLNNIQIVNGGQTIHSLKESLNESNNIENVSILCKIYQTNNKDLKARIAEFTNNQNPVKGRDIRSIDEVQMKLEKEFELLGYCYERKKNQYKDQAKEKRLDSEKIGQVLFAYNGKPAESKNKKSLIFDSEYDNIFNSKIDAKDILKKYKLYLFIEDKKMALEKDYSFLRYATYYILYICSILIKQKNYDIEQDKENIYQESLEKIKYIVDKEKEKQGEKFLEHVLFKGNIPKSYLSELGLDKI